MATMRAHIGQGATQLSSGTTYRAMLAQGATEYLVLLAVVLIVALVSVALLGFFPGIASDAQITQSQTYWKSAQPISVIDTGAIDNTGYSAGSAASPYIRIRNSGAYPIRITKMLGGSGHYASWIYTAGSPTFLNISDTYYLGPGEEAYFGNPGLGASLSWRHIDVFADGGGGDGTQTLRAASTLCNRALSPPGILQMNNFGFEYIEYVEGQQITKREIGAKPLIVKCSG